MPGINKQRVHAFEQLKQDNQRAINETEKTGNTERRISKMSITRFFEQLAIIQDAKLKQMDKVNYLMEEFADTTNDLFLWVIKYCADNNIPIWNEKQFENRIEDAKRILQEIHESSVILDRACKENPTDFDKENNRRRLDRT